MHRASLAVILAAVAVLAGCGTPLSPRGGAEATLTPVPVPETRSATTDGADTLAPGLRESGVVATGRLAAAHASVLAATSFTVEQSVVRRYQNGTLVNRYRTVTRMSADKRRFHYVLHQTARRDGRLRETRIERFGADGRTFTLDRAGVRSDRVRGTAVRAFFPANASNRRALQRLLARVDTTVAGRSVRNGTTLYRVTIDGGRTDAPPLRNVSMVAFVDESGLISEYHLEYDVVHEGASHHVVVDVAYTRLGETTIERPPWVDRVPTDTPAAPSR